mgnify:CR=1 FL=1
MKIISLLYISCTLFLYSEVKLEEIPRLNKSTALKILAIWYQELIDQKVDVGIVIVGIDGRILASSKSKKMDVGLYDFAKFKAQTSCLKGVSTEELPARNGQIFEICLKKPLEVEKSN